MRALGRKVATKRTATSAAFQSGSYTLRFVAGFTPFDGGYPAQLTTPPLHVRVTHGERSSDCCFATLLLLARPWLRRRMHLLDGFVWRVRSENPVLRRELEAA